MDPTKSEYEIQFIGFSTLEIEAETRIMVEHFVDKLSTQLIEHACTDLSTEESVNIKKAHPKLVENLCTSVRKRFNHVDNVIEKTFSVPDNVLLWEDQPYKKQYTLEDEEAMEKLLEEMEWTVQQAKLSVSLLQKEMQAFEGMQSIFEKETELYEKLKLAFLENVAIDAQVKAEKDLIEKFFQRNSEIPSLEISTLDLIGKFKK